MPGNASSRLPVTLRVLSQQKANIIIQTFDVLQHERLPLVSTTMMILLVSIDTANRLKASLSLSLSQDLYPSLWRVSGTLGFLGRP